MPTDDDDLTDKLRASAPPTDHAPDVDDLWSRAQHRRHRRRALSAVAVVVAVVALGGGALAFTGGDDVDVETDMADDTGSDGTPDGESPESCGEVMDSYLRPDTDLLVYLEPEISADQRSTVIEEYRALPAVSSVHLVDQNEVYEQFRELFADSPEIVETVDPAILPAYLEVGVADDVDLTSFIEARTPLDPDGGIRELVTRRRVAAGDVCDTGDADPLDTVPTTTVPTTTVPTTTVPGSNTGQMEGVFVRTSDSWEPGQIQLLRDGSIRVAGYNTFVETERPDYASDPQPSVIELLGLLPEDSTIEHPDGSTSALERDIQVSENPDGIVTVTVTEEVDGDDSVSGSRTTVRFQRQDGQLRFVDGTWAQRCARPGTTDEFVVGRVCP